MSALMLVTNPIKRKGKKMATRKKARSPAQKRATAALVALNRKAPVRRRRSVAKTVGSTVRRVKRRVVTHAKRARRNHASLHKGGFGIINLLKQAGIGAVGSIAVDVVYNKLPLPASMKSGNVAPIVKAGVTIGLGLLAGRFLNKQLAHGATVGALTVQLRDVMHNFLPASMQGYTDINGVEYYSPAITDGVGAYLSANEEHANVGAYMSGVGVDDYEYSMNAENVY